MPSPRHPVTVVDAHDPGTGRWVHVVDEGTAVGVSVGRIDRLGQRRRRWSWRVLHVDERLEVLATWPVSEMLTDRIGTVVGRLGVELAAAGGDPTSGFDAVRAAVARLAGVDEAPTLDGTLWRAAFPLLRPAIERGERIDEVPAVLGPLLRWDSLRVGVRRSFGRPTRPLVRACAARLLPADGGAPVFDPLVLAAMAATVCGPERLTEIVSTDPVEPGLVAFAVADVDRARRAFAGRSPRAVTDLLRSSLAEPGGTGRLAERLAAWSPPEPPPAPPEPAPRRAAPVAATPPAAPRPPAARTVLDAPIAHPPAWLAAEGQVVAGHTVVLAHTTAELAAWGMLLDNCLGSFGDAAAGGRSRILGLAGERGVRFVVEVTPGGVIRQIEGAGNRQPSPPLGREIARRVIALGLATSDGRTGRSLVAPR